MRWFWGDWEGGDKAVLAMKSLADHTSIYTLNPVLPASFFRALARRAGAHIYHHRSDTFYASTNFLCVNADGAGRRNLRFPKPVDLVDPFTGKRRAQKHNSI